MNNDLIKSFSVDDIAMYRQDSDVDFAEVEIFALAEGGNTHNNPISLDVLKKDADTFLGKFIVAKYDKWTKDVTTHVPDEAIIGYIDPRQTVEFKEKVVNGVSKTFAVVKGLLSKLYATEIVEMFRQHNQRDVSCEFSCATLYEEDANGVPLAEHGTPMYGEENPILDYSIHGITVLGLKVNPSVAGAEMQIKRFADEASKLVSHPMHKDEYVDTDWDGEKSKHDAIKEKDFDTMAKSIFLKLDADYKDRKIGSLHYPVMGLYDSVWKYNKNGLSSARAYGEQHDKDVAEKAIKIQKKLGLYETNNKEETMQDEKKFEAEKTDDIVMSDAEKEKEMSAENSEKEEKEMAENVKETSDENKDIQVDTTEEQEEKDFACGTEKETSEKCSEDELDKDEDDKDEDDSEDKEEKPFALSDYIDDIEREEMLKDEIEEHKAFVDKVCSMSAKELLQTVLSFEKENEGLKEFKANAENKEKELKLSAILENVRNDIDEKKFAELKEEGSKLSLNELGGFENKVKAFAYDFKSQNNKVENEDIMTFAGVHDEQVKERTADDIFNEYL